ncbi:MAG: NfeD family protein [Thermoguttaceae bacterium]
MDYWIWAFLLLLLGMCLGVLEVFITSAGILSFLSAASIIAAVVLGYMGPHGYVVGSVILGLAVVGMPVLVVLAFKYWPYTPMGKRMLLAGPESEDVLPENRGKEYLKSLLGRVAKTKSKLLPSGIIVIDGHNVDAVSEGIAIEVGQEVRIVQVRGRQAVVRPLEIDTPSETAENPLRRPIESVIEDPFSDPPA